VKREWKEGDLRKGRHVSKWREASGRPRKAVSQNLKQTEKLGGISGGGYYGYKESQKGQLPREIASTKIGEVDPCIGVDKTVGNKIGSAVNKGNL